MGIYDSGSQYIGLIDHTINDQATPLRFDLIPNDDV